MAIAAQDIQDDYAEHMHDYRQFVRIVQIVVAGVAPSCCCLPSSSCEGCAAPWYSAVAIGLAIRGGFQSPQLVRSYPGLHPCNTNPPLRLRSPRLVVCRDGAFYEASPTTFASKAPGRVNTAANSPTSTHSTSSTSRRRVTHS